MDKKQIADTVRRLESDIQGIRNRIGVYLTPKEGARQIRNKKEDIEFVKSQNRNCNI